MAQPKMRAYMQQVSRDSYHRRKLRALDGGPLEPEPIRFGGCKGSESPATPPVELE
jgi:hypothetical protein